MGSIPRACIVGAAAAASACVSEPLSLDLMEARDVAPAFHSGGVHGTYATPVTDLRVAESGRHTATLAWTSVDDGTGNPARYRAKYAEPPIDWRTATRGCDVKPGDLGIGAEVRCEVEGLDPRTAYEFQLMSYRMVDGHWEGAVYSNVASGATDAPDAPGPVDDLQVSAATATTMTMRWTQVVDGMTNARGGSDPAWYRVKYAESPLVDWKNATIGCDRTLEGDEVGADMSCIIEGLEAETTYDVQLMSYRMEDGHWEGAVYSNIATGTTPDARARGLWVAPDRLAALPRSGPAWENFFQYAETPCGSVDLSDPERYTHLCIMTKALIYAATGDERRREEVVAALADFNTDTYTGTAWVLGRELPAYVIAADLVGLASHDPELDEAFRAQLVRLRSTPTDSGPADLVECHEERPNNWGTHCGAARAAIAAYLADTDELDRIADVFRGYLGDRSAYAGFVYGGPENDLTWQCDPTEPVGVNPAGCTRDGRAIGGVLPDDQRRGGPFGWPPPRENYVWEALQGAVAQAVILHRAGYEAFAWGDRALLRAVEWLHRVAEYPAEGDDEWVPHVINHFYGTDFPASVPALPGKGIAWTDWTHG